MSAARDCCNNLHHLAEDGEARRGFPGTCPPCWETLLRKVVAERDAAVARAEGLRAMALRIAELVAEQTAPPNSAQCRSCGRPVTPCPAYPGYRFMCLPVIRKPGAADEGAA